MDRHAYFLCLIICSYSYASCPSRWPPNDTFQHRENLDSLTEDPIFGLDPARGKKKNWQGNNNIWVLQSYQADYPFTGFLISVTDIGPAKCGSSSLSSVSDDSKTWSGCKKVLRSIHTKDKLFSSFTWTLPKCGCAVLRATVIAKRRYYFLENDDNFDGPLAKTICKNEDETEIQSEDNMKKVALTSSMKEFLKTIPDLDDFPDDSNDINMKLDISYITDPLIEVTKQSYKPKNEKSIIMRNIINKINRTCSVVLSDNNNNTSDQQNNSPCMINHQELRDCCILSQTDRFKCFIELKNRHIDKLCNNTLQSCAWKWDSWSFQQGQHECCQETGRERYRCFNHTFWIHHKEAFDAILPSDEHITTTDILNFTVDSTHLATADVIGKINQANDTGLVRSRNGTNKVNYPDNQFKDKTYQSKDQSMILNLEIPAKQFPTSRENMDIAQKEEKTKSDDPIQSKFYNYCCRNGIEESSKIKILLFAFHHCQDLAENFYRENSDLVNDEIDCQKVFKNCCIQYVMRPLVKRSADKELNNLFK